MHLPMIRKHHYIVRKHQRGDIWILLDPFFLDQWPVMSTPDAVCHGEKRQEELTPQSVNERVKKPPRCPGIWALET